MNLLIVLGVVVAFGVLRFARASLLLWAIAVTLGPDQAFIVGSAGVAAKLICMYLDTRVRG